MQHYISWEPAINFVLVSASGHANVHGGQWLDERAHDVTVRLAYTRCLMRFRGAMPAVKVSLTVNHGNINVVKYPVYDSSPKIIIQSTVTAKPSLLTYPISLPICGDALSIDPQGRQPYILGLQCERQCFSC